MVKMIAMSGRKLTTVPTPAMRPSTVRDMSHLGALASSRSPDTPDVSGPVTSPSSQS